MEIYLTMVGYRQFLNIGDVYVIPVDRIKKFDFTVANGGASGESVRIVTDDPDEEIIFAYENCEAIREFIESNKLEVKG